MKRDDFKQYAVSLRGKNQKFKKMKKELEEVRSELNVLMRTEEILKSRATDLDGFMDNLAKEKGISGFDEVEENQVRLAMEKQKYDQVKEKTLEELTDIVGSIETQLKEKKAKLAPQIKQLRAYRSKYSEMEVTYNEKKKTYDNTVMNLESEKSRLNEEIDKKWTDYKTEETKYHYMNIQSKIYDAMLKKLKEESNYLKKPDARLSDDLKSFNELYQTKVQQEEEMIMDLKKHQRYVKENYENNAVQVDLFANLFKILSVKEATIGQIGGDVEIGYEDNGGQGVDNLVLRK